MSVGGFKVDWSKLDLYNFDEEDLKYKEDMEEIATHYFKADKTAKYAQKFDHYFVEKRFIVKNMNLDGIQTALDIGTGAGMIPYLLRKEGVECDGTELSDEMLKSQQSMYPDFFNQCNDLIGLKRKELFIEPMKPMNLSKDYDLINANRVEFDRDPEFDWNYFINDCFKHCKRVMIKLNYAGKTFPYHKCSDSDAIRPFIWNPGKNLKYKDTIYSKKPFRAWYITIDRDQWDYEEEY